jgi:hypothetical protein
MADLRRRGHVAFEDRRARRVIPGMLAPLLQEVGIAARLLHDRGHRLVGKFHALLPGRFGDGQSSGHLVQRPNLGKVEQALGVGLGAAHATGQLRQPGSDQRHGQAPLCAAMQRRDERGKLGLLNVLQLVDEQDDCRTGLLGGVAHCLQQRLQVVLEVAIVGQPRLRLEVQADLDVPVLHLQGLGEPGQGSQRALRQGFGRLLPAQTQQRLAQLRRQQRRQGTAFRRFHAQGLHAGGLRVVAHAIQQHRLAHAAQTHHQHALGGQAAPQALDAHAHVFAQVVAAGQLGRARPGSGRVGIPERIHPRQLISILGDLA